MKPEEMAPVADPRTLFAAERTLLAWVRTGLAMMGFGFVVARFGLFLREIASMEAEPVERRLGVSLWVGTALVLLGVAVNVCAAFKHYHDVARLDRGEPLRFRPLALGNIVALVLALLGVIVAIYLIFGLHDGR
ncbi:MAG TPA: DUF202 domain-containing protein [Pirellulales bacterium]|nr:DUF202 domain-containing protein [Pirellulales bacterium]